MWIENGFIVRISSKLRDFSDSSKATVDWLLSFDGKPLLLPEGFQPDHRFLQSHASRRIS
jgi:hypothetical protein